MDDVITSPPGVVTSDELIIDDLGPSLGTRDRLGGTERGGGGGELKTASPSLEVRDVLEADRTDTGIMDVRDGVAPILKVVCNIVEPIAVSSTTVLEDEGEERNGMRLELS